MSLVEVIHGWTLHRGCTGGCCWSTLHRPHSTPAAKTCTTLPGPCGWTYQEICVARKASQTCHSAYREEETGSSSCPEFFFPTHIPETKMPEKDWGMYILHKWLYIFKDWFLLPWQPSISPPPTLIFTFIVLVHNVQHYLSLSCNHFHHAAEETAGAIRWHSHSYLQHSFQCVNCIYLQI